MIRSRRYSRHFLYCVKRNLYLPRNFIIAENWRRFWRRTKGWGQQERK
jgi:hypothetical protein